jgi:hypothetical protein
MPNLTHKDVQVSSDRPDNLKTIVREVNTRLRETARVVSENYGEPFVVSAPIEKSTALYAPFYPETLIGIYYYGVETSTQVLAVNDLSAPIPGSNAPYDISGFFLDDFTEPYRLDRGQNVEIVLQTPKILLVSLLLRRPLTTTEFSS